MSDTEFGAIDCGDVPRVLDAQSDNYDEDDISVNLWTKKGKRLYLNGISNRSNPYIELGTGAVEDNASAEYELKLVDDGGKLVVTREHYGSETRLLVDLDVAESEGDDDRTDKTPDHDGDDAPAEQEPAGDAPGDLEMFDTSMVGDTDGLSEDEKVTLLKENVVGHVVDIPNGYGRCEIASARPRPRDGRLEVLRVPLDHNGQPTRMNKSWISVRYYWENALRADGDWTVVEA